MLLIQRARILKKTESKLEAIDRIIRDFKLTRSLIYCADRDQLEDVQQIIREHQIPHTVYIGDTPKEERDSALDALGRGNIPILLATALWKDLPQDTQERIKALIKHKLSLDYDPTMVDLEWWD